MKSSEPTINFSEKYLSFQRGKGFSDSEVPPLKKTKAETASSFEKQTGISEGTLW